MKRRIFFSIAALVGVVGLFTAANAGAAPSVTVVMSGLDNPRGLAFGPEGALTSPRQAAAGRGLAFSCAQCLRPFATARAEP